MDINLEFNLVKSKVDEQDLRAYLYQCIYKIDDNQVCLQSVKDLCILTDEQLRDWNDGRNLELLNFEKLKLVFDKLGYEYPEYIYYINPTYDFDREDYRSYPQLFNQIESLCFDNGGLIVLYSDIISSYHLFSSKGTELLRSNYSEIRIGVNGLIQFDDYFTVEDKIISEIAVNWNQLKTTYNADLYENNEDNFPDIKGRDKISLMEEWTNPVCEISDLEQLFDIDSAKGILKEDGCLIRYMPKSIQENEELAFTACVQNKLAFTLLPKKLQNNNEFVTKLLDSKDVETDICNYIYFKKIKTNTALDEENRIKEPLIPLWSPLIIDKFDSITPNLSKKNLIILNCWSTYIN